MLRIRCLRRALEPHPTSTRAGIGTAGGRIGQDEGRAAPPLDAGEWLTQEVDAENASYGRGHHRPRLVDGGILAVSSATLATGGDSGLGRSASPASIREVEHPGCQDEVCSRVSERAQTLLFGTGWRLGRSPGWVTTLDD
jgi:hypothetical protein